MPQLESVPRGRIGSLRRQDIVVILILSRRLVGEVDSEMEVNYEPFSKVEGVVLRIHAVSVIALVPIRIISGIDGI